MERRVQHPQGFQLPRSSGPDTSEAPPRHLPKTTATPAIHSLNGHEGDLSSWLQSTIRDSCSKPLSLDRPLRGPWSLCPWNSRSPPWTRRWFPNLFTRSSTLSPSEREQLASQPGMWSPHVFTIKKYLTGSSDEESWENQRRRGPGNPPMSSLWFTVPRVPSGHLHPWSKHPWPQGKVLWVAGWGAPRKPGHAGGLCWDTTYPRERQAGVSATGHVGTTCGCSL